MNSLFFLLYTIVATLLYLAAIPFLLLYALKSKYSKSIPARFFLWKNPPLKADGIWFHACSFGEIRALAPFREIFSGEKLRFTATTQTGYEESRKYSAESRYLPYESLLFFWMNPQKVLVVMEAEFWYLLFALAQKRGAKTLLINARMSERSYPKYLKLRWLYRKIFSHIDEVYAQTEQDKERLEHLGAKQVRVTGNIKLASLPAVSRTLPKPDGLIVCAASTHEGEEVLILKAFAALKAKEQEAKLLLVPRHPERFEKVSRMAESFAAENGFDYGRYSEDENFTKDILLIDRLGELVNLYAISDVVVLGGAFAPIGGHNAAEAAQFGCRIISGEHSFNQRDIFAAVEGIRVVEEKELSDVLLDYRSLPKCSMKVKSDISPIVESINNVL
ncbi:MAG: lipid IV(A) 3-deoxy-D-manno-octulosonic acid transferase [Campylobacterota bacterium]|nr:lipid IV(A) 3-deoxy-D-manno-octulosonic acid transferase [Campylobacterota bacterium]